MKSPTAKPKRPHYVDNKRMYREIVEYRQAKKQAIEAKQTPPVIPAYVGECILKIAKNLASKPNFVSYSFVEEMISDGVENCILYFDGYDPEVSQNPFAYFTQIVYNAFIRRIGKEHKNRYTIYKSFTETYSHDSELWADSEGNQMAPTQLYDNINNFMNRFEDREINKKNKRLKEKSEKKGLSRFIEVKNE